MQLYIELIITRKYILNFFLCKLRFEIRNPNKRDNLNNNAYVHDLLKHFCLRRLQTSFQELPLQVANKSAIERCL